MEFRGVQTTNQMNPDGIFHVVSLQFILHSTCPLIFQPAGFILLILWLVIINPMTLILNTQFLWSQWNVEIPYKTMVSFRGYFFRGKGLSLLYYILYFPLVN